MKVLIAGAAALAAGTLLVACGGANGNDFSSYERLPESGWRFAKAVEFAPVHADSVCTGALVVALRHDNSYPYKGICLEVEMTDGGRERRDTIDISFAGDYGQWIGRGIGTSFQLTDTLAPVRHVTGSSVRIRHLMRTDTLAGINQVGLFFVPVKNN